MTKTVTLNLTLDELKTLDKFMELNDETRPLFDKIRSAYPEPKITFENHGDFDVVSYQDPENSNSGDETYWRIIQPNSFSWWRRYTVPQRLDMVQNTEKEQELEKLYQEQLEREMIKRHLKPHTPEQTEKSLREAFQKVQQTEEWKETQRKIDAPKESWMDKPVEELVAMLEKNPPDCLKFVMGKTLEDRIYKWWETCFSRHPEWSMEECVEDLLDIITLFLPAEQSHEGTQNIDTVVAVEAHNELLQKIKSKLRNKKA